MKYLVVLMLMVVPIFGIAQEQKDTSEQEMFIDPYNYPKFPGGQVALTQYIKENFKPESQVCGVEGTIIVGFYIEVDSTISEVEVKRGLHPDYDKEAIQVIKAMPKWKPGRIRDKIIRVRMMVPVKVNPDL